MLPGLFEGFCRRFGIVNQEKSQAGAKYSYGCNWRGGKHEGLRSDEQKKKKIIEQSLSLFARGDLNIGRMPPVLHKLSAWEGFALSLLESFKLQGFDTLTL